MFLISLKGGSMNLWTDKPLSTYSVTLIFKYFPARLHAYTLYLLTDKEPLSPECTLAAGSLLEVFQELCTKTPTDVVQLIHAWNEQVNVCEGIVAPAKILTLQVCSRSHLIFRKSRRTSSIQEHNSYQLWLGTKEQASQKIGQPIPILNKSINAQAEIITTTIFNTQGY